MPFDPTYPPAHAEIESAPLRSQFNALKALIDAVPAGPAGPQGPAFADAAVTSVTTLDPGQPAVVGIDFDGSTVNFSFEIPRGQDGSDGANGEVSALELQDAIAGTSANSNGVDFLYLTVSDPPTMEEMQSIVDKVNELITALRR